MGDQKILRQLNREALLNNKPLKKALGKMPEAVQDSFTNEQLEGIKSALEASAWKKHTVDIRSSISFFSYHYYYVFIAGRDQREMSRDEIRFKRLMYLTFFSLFITFSTLLGLLVLYLIKSAMGIDIFPNFSLGIWTWFKGAFNV
ncbi:MAG: 3-phosphoshikimate 1-carboxyvinyltransferase [Psychromonas sp.]|nr:3-phosphoshikimate 1-carboxyvinyltransferase [Psychromonas sp.]